MYLTCPHTLHKLTKLQGLFFAVSTAKEYLEKFPLQAVILCLIFLQQSIYNWPILSPAVPRDTRYLALQSAPWNDVFERFFKWSTIIFQKCHPSSNIIQIFPASITCHLFKDSFLVTVEQYMICRSTVVLPIRVDQAQSNNSPGPFISVFPSQYVWRGSGGGIELAQYVWLQPFTWNLREVEVGV